jgi:RNA polymerase sigma-70 factor (ECF subfamily)
MCKNEYRSREVRKIMETMSDFGPEVPRERLDDERIDREQFQHGLMHELENLSEEHRSVFLLRYQEDRSIKEISEILGCTEGTVKSRTFYALRKLALRLHLFDPKL